MSKEKLLINDFKSNNSEVMSNNEELNANCVCLKCYKLRCKSRSNPKERCPELSGPVDWKGRSNNDRR